jgi:predicted nuclease of predicted toxin-antitoxin system
MTKTILLDENLPRQLKNLFSSDFKIYTVYQLKWQSKKNGELLSAMSSKGIEILMTTDRNLEFQQNLDKYPIQFVILITYDNRLKSLKPTIPFIETELSKLTSTDKILYIDLRALVQ